jgi:hypothetical protein
LDFGRKGLSRCVLGYADGAPSSKPGPGGVFDGARPPAIPGAAHRASIPPESLTESIGYTVHLY